MAESRAPRILDEMGPAAPPRKNGELVFEHVWEGRMFGLTMALHGSGAFVWDEFRARLIEEISAWERRYPTGEGYRYYEHWLAALERVVTDKGLCGSAISRCACASSRPGRTGMITRRLTRDGSSSGRGEPSWVSLLVWQRHGGPVRATG